MFLFSAQYHLKKFVLFEQEVHENFHIVKFDPSNLVTWLTSLLEENERIAIFCK